MEPKRSPLKDDKGFTLLEILISMTIVAVVMSIIFTSYTGGMKIIKDTTDQSAVYAMARVALSRIVEDLACSCRPVSMSEISEENNNEEDTAGFSGRDEAIYDRHADSMSFFSRAHPVLPGEALTPGMASISYYVKEEGDNRLLALYRSDSAVLTELPDEKSGGHVLCDGLCSVDFVYRDLEGNVFDNWDSSTGEFKDKLPVTVSVFLEFENRLYPENPFKFMTTVFLPTAVAGYEKDA